MDSFNSDSVSEPGDEFYVCPTFIVKPYAVISLGFENCGDFS